MPPRRFKSVRGLYGASRSRADELCRAFSPLGTLARGRRWAVLKIRRTSHHRIAWLRFGAMDLDDVDGPSVLGTQGRGQGSSPSAARTAHRCGCLRSSVLSRLTSPALRMAKTPRTKEHSSKCRQIAI